MRSCLLKNDTITRMEFRMITRWFRIAMIAGALAFASACTQTPKPLFSPLPLPELSQSEARELDSHYRQAWSLLLGGVPDRALAELKQSRSPDSYIYTGFGYIYLVKRNYSLAEKNFKRALNSAEDDLMAQSGLGLLYEMMGKNDEAFALFKSVKRKYPDHSWVEMRYDRLRVLLTEERLKMAEAAKNSGSDERYLSELEKAQFYSPDMTEIAQKVAARYQEMGHPEKAVSAYRQLLKRDPHNTLYLQTLAGIYVSMKAYDNALILYRRLLDLNPNDEQIRARIEQVKQAFGESNWPRELKGIFFKEQLNREDTAALIGLYFPSVLSEPQRLIISDIAGSFAFKEIIRVCASGIMDVRPDHRFDRFGLLNKGQYALILDRLIKAIRERGRTLDFQPISDYTPPQDIPPTHKDYQIIISLLSIGLIDLDMTNQFHPLDPVHPDELINSLKKIEMAMSFNDESQMNMSPGVKDEEEVTAKIR